MNMEHGRRDTMMTIGQSSIGGKSIISGAKHLRGDMQEINREFMALGI